MANSQLPAWPSITDRVSRILPGLLTDQANWLALDSEYAAEGYRAPHCIHGADMWVDYDCACGACEAGVFTAYSSTAEVRAYAVALAESQAATEIATAHQCALMVNWAMRWHYETDPADWAALVDHLTEPLTLLTARHRGRRLPPPAEGRHFLLLTARHRGRW